MKAKPRPSFLICSEVALASSHPLLFPLLVETFVYSNSPKAKLKLSYCKLFFFFPEMKNLESGGLWEEKGRGEQKEGDICFLFLPSGIPFFIVLIIYFITVRVHQS